jgi:hypothetical protein
MKTNTNTSYIIRVARHYYGGGIGITQRSTVCNMSGSPILYGSMQEAMAAIEGFDNSPYETGHGKHSRSTYTVRKSS